jgi:hypothetical protein
MKYKHYLRDTTSPRKLEKNIVNTSLHKYQYKIVSAKFRVATTLAGNCDLTW